LLVKQEFKQSRFRILLAVPLIIIMSIIVILISSHSVKSVTDNAELLVSSQIPELRAISELQSILNRQLIMTHDYYATTELPDTSITNKLDKDFFTNLKVLVGIEQNTSGGIDLVDLIGKFKISSKNFHDEMQKGGNRDWDVLREHLAEVSMYARQANTVLEDWHLKVRKRLSSGGSLTLAEISQLNIIQITFNIFMLVIAGFLLAIIYFRMVDQERQFHGAHFDPLTDLPNRRSMQLWSEKIVAQNNNSPSLYTMWLTLDRLGLISGTYGHHLGNELICEFSKELEEVLEKSTLEINLFSIGSSNWVIFIKNVLVDDTLKKIISDIEKFTNRPFNIDGREFNVASSIGISHIPAYDNNLQYLLKNADTARTAVLNDGGNDHRFYAPEMTEEAENLLTVENGLRKALENDEFELHYQPKMSKNGTQALSSEALIRWRSNGELISPVVFIPVAEKTGLVHQIGDWVLLQACNQWIEWQQTGIDIPSVAVNISAQQFQSKQFVDKVKNVLEVTGIPPAKLELELTEEAASVRPDMIVSVMQSLKALGVSLAIDDFGTGYSSLAYLKRFPIDVIKIDRAFIMHLEISSQDKAIVKLIIEMSHELGFKVVAEGVENDEQFQILKSMECDLLQGFYFSRPLTSTDYLDFLNKIENTS